ncbi:hypothetical protein ACOMHN_000805 [Nucella lapillus]
MFMKTVTGKRFQVSSPAAVKTQLDRGAPSTPPPPHQDQGRSTMWFSEHTVHTVRKHASSHTVAGPRLAL